MEKYLESYPAVLDVKDIANILNINYRTANKFIKNGHIKYIQIGRLIRIPKTNLIEYLQNSQN